MCDLFGCGNSSDKPLPPVSDEERRNFLKGIAALPLAAVLACPELARAVRPFAIPLGAGEVTGFVAMPEKKPAPTLLLVHEWWGLNDNIKAVAAEFAAQGYIAAAIDL